jgi:hypothetical protein
VRSGRVLSRKQTSRVAALTVAGAITGNQLVLFDHLVGAGKEGRRHSQPERLRGLDVDDKLELRRELNWERAGLGTIEDF